MLTHDCCITLHCAALGRLIPPCCKARWHHEIYPGLPPMRSRAPRHMVGTLHTSLTCIHSHHLGVCIASFIFRSIIFLKLGMAAWTADSINSRSLEADIVSKGTGALMPSLGRPAAASFSLCHTAVPSADVCFFPFSEFLPSAQMHSHV